MRDLATLFFGFLPPFFQVLVMIAIVVLVAIVLFKIVALIWDALPFV